MNDSKLNKAEKQQKPVANKIDKIILSLALIIPIAFVAYRYFTAPPAGFCVAQNRFVPAEEFIKLALENNRTKLEDNYGKATLTSSNYKVVNCCVVRRIRGDFLSKIFKLDEGVMVFIAYERTREMKENSASSGLNATDKYGWNFSSFDSCAVPTRFISENAGGAAYLGGEELPPRVADLKEFIKWPK